jgi:predicted ATPase
LIEGAVDQWHKAGQQAADRSANLEAIAQLKKALELLKAIPEGRARDEKEAAVQITLGVPLIALKGYGGSEVQEVYARALELCRNTGKTADLFPVLRGQWNWHLLRLQAAGGRLSLPGRRESISQNLYYRWSKEFLEAGKIRAVAAQHQASGLTDCGPAASAPRWTNHFTCSASRPSATWTIPARFGCAGGSQP